MFDNSHAPNQYEPTSEHCKSNITELLRNNSIFRERSCDLLRMMSCTTLRAKIFRFISRLSKLNMSNGLKANAPGNLGDISGSTPTNVFSVTGQLKR